MDEDAFWQLIEDCRPAEPDPEAELLAPAVVERLARSPLSLVTGFAEQLSWALHRLDRKEYGYDLSDDAFLYTPYATDLIWAESLLYTPDRAYGRITGEEWDRDTRYSYESCSNTEGGAD